MKKRYPKKQWADQRALYFAFSEDDLPSHLADRWRSEHVQPAQIEEIKTALKHYLSRKGE